MARTAVPALNNPNKDACFVYVAHDGGDSGYLRLFELDAHNKWTVVNWQPPTKSGGGQCSGRDPSAGNASRRSRWMTYDGPNDVLGDQSSEGNENLWWVDGRKKGRPPLKGIISLSPCKDGTILASIYNRWLFTATDTLRLYTSGYSIDL